MARDIFRLGYSVRMEADSDAAEIMLYGQIVEDGPKWWKWSEEDKSAAEFDKAVKDVRAKGAKKLLLRINSPGGVCTESVAMRAILADAGFEEINIRIEGLCASAATDIATLPGAHVAICEGSEYMIHNPWCVALGNANELMQTIERLRNIEETSRGFYAKKSGQSEEQIKDWMDAETWFTAKEAVEYGFADELLEAEAQGGTPAAACVRGREMAAMKGMYRRVPEEIGIMDTQGERPEGAGNAPDNVSNEEPDAGDSTENTIQREDDSGMDIKELTMDQLRAENPGLMDEIRQAAVAEERQRLEDIDALTVPGYEDMAQEAKAQGTSAMDFQKQVVAAMKQKGQNWLQQRERETQPAQSVTGGAPGTEKDDQDMKNSAKEIAAYAKTYRGGASSDGGMY